MNTQTTTPPLYLPAHTLRAVMDHVQTEHPIEACGVILTDPQDCLEVIPMDNAEQSETNYSFDTEQWLEINRRLDQTGQTLLAIYHSHTRSEPIPSRSDIRLAAYPDAWYLIVSTWPQATQQARAYRIGGGVAVETPLVTIHCEEAWIDG